MKVRFFVCFIFFLKTFICEDNQFVSQENVKKIFTDMGFDGKERITRKEFQSFFYKVIAKNKESAQNKLFYEEVSRKLSLQVPQEFNMKDTMNYLKQERIMTAIEDTVREQYGEQYVPMIREQFKKSFFTDKKETIEKEKQQTKEKEDIEESESEVINKTEKIEEEESEVINNTEKIEEVETSIKTEGENTDEENSSRDEL